MHRIYLDYNATTPIDPLVLELMTKLMQDTFGNPSSLHREGAQASLRLNEARESMARCLGCDPRELVFTSGGTEAINLALKGVLKTTPGHLITTAVEHQAVLQSAKWLETRGVAVTHLGVSALGELDLGALEQAFRPETRLISVMMANNEIGNLYPIEAIGKIARAHGVLFHVDGVQALGKIPICLKDLPVDLMSFSGHKIYGPKGIGLLYVRRGVKLERLVDGGSQEMEQRGGTENLAGIAGMAKALELCMAHLPEEIARLTQVRDTLEQGLRAIPETYVHGLPQQRIANTLNVSFTGITKETILLALDREGIAVSSGSACASGAIEPSHVLLAMGLPRGEAMGAVRFSLGRWTTGEEIGVAIERVTKVVNQLRM